MSETKGTSLRNTLVKVVCAVFRVFHGFESAASPPSPPENEEERRRKEEELEKAMLSSWILVESPLTQRDCIAGELAKIREQRAGTTGLNRKIFAKVSSDLFETMPSEQRALLADEKIESSDRSRIVSDAAERHANDWMKVLRGVFLPQEEEGKEDLEKIKIWEEWISRFEETKFQKGVIGEMKGIAWQTSHASAITGLTSRLLGEIAWSLFNSLHLSIRIALGRELTENETTIIIEAVKPCTGTLLELWTINARISKNGRKREGRLGNIWREEEVQKAKEVAKRKKKGEIIPTFDPSPVIVQQEEHSSMTFQQRCSLEERLQFRFIPDYSHRKSNPPQPK